MKRNNIADVILLDDKLIDAMIINYAFTLHSIFVIKKFCIIHVHDCPIHKKSDQFLRPKSKVLIHEENIPTPKLTQLFMKFVIPENVSRPGGSGTRLCVIRGGIS